MKAYDLIIVGGGPAGGVLSLLLAEGGLRIALIDHVDPKEILKETYDGRTTALSAGSVEILKWANVWDALAAEAEGIRRIFVSQKNGSECLQYGPQESGREIMGYIVENRFFRKVLFEAFKRHPTLHFFAPFQIKSLSVLPAKVSVSIGHETFSAPLCIGADGRHSFVRKTMEARVRRFPYHQSALVFNVSISKPHEGRAYEHFLPSGPLAFLPMKGKRCSVVWSVKENLLKALTALEEDAFSEELQHHFGDALGKIRLLTKRWVYPMALQYVETLIAPRLALVGDAAHVIHPVAGQGLNLGFRDVEKLAMLLLEAKDLGLDLGSLTVLNPYQKDRQFDILSMSAITDGLVRLFSNNSTSLRYLRGTGLKIVDNIPPLKRFLTRHAMGLLGR